MLHLNKPLSSDNFNCPCSSSKNLLPAIVQVNWERDKNYYYTKRHSRDSWYCLIKLLKGSISFLLNEDFFNFRWIFDKWPSFVTPSARWQHSLSFVKTSLDFKWVMTGQRNSLGSKIILKTISQLISTKHDCSLKHDMGK